MADMGVIRCRKCKRFFSELADHCAHCGQMSFRGRLVGIVIKSAVVLAIVALVLTLYFSNKYRATVPQGGYVAPPERVKPPVRRDPN